MKGVFQAEKTSYHMEAQRCRKTREQQQRQIHGKSKVISTVTKYRES